MSLQSPFSSFNPQIADIGTKVKINPLTTITFSPTQSFVLIYKQWFSQVDCRAEVGSPTPKWRRPSLEEQLILEEPPADGRPVIRLTRCPDVTNPLPVAPTIHIPSRYTPLEPIKRRNSQQTWIRINNLSCKSKILYVIIPLIIVT